MSRYSISQASELVERIQNYEKKEKQYGYFQLKNDRDSARVYFLAATLDDIDILTVHNVPMEYNGKPFTRFVDCQRAEGQQISACPICALNNEWGTGFGSKLKVFIQLYNADTNQLEVWSTNYKVFATLQLRVSRIRELQTEPIYSRCFEIIRNGKKGDTQTTYMIEECISSDEKYRVRRKEELPQKLDLIECGYILTPNQIVFDKSSETFVYANSGGSVKKEEITPRAVQNPVTEPTPQTYAPRTATNNEEKVTTPPITSFTRRTY